MRHRALFVTSRAARCRNKMLLARENVDSPLAAMVVATEHNALLASGSQPPSIDNGTGSRLNRVPAACSIRNIEGCLVCGIAPRRSSNDSHLGFHLFLQSCGRCSLSTWSDGLRSLTWSDIQTARSCQGVQYRLMPSDW